jgi:PAP2 superfamily
LDETNPSPPTSDKAAAQSDRSIRDARRLPWSSLRLFLPHELVFGAFLLLTWARLAAAAGPFNRFTLFFLGALLGALGLVAWFQRDPGARRWRIRLLYYPIVMGLTFYTLRHAVPKLGRPLVDVHLLALDRVLFGETPSVSYQTWAKPWLNDLLMLGYLFFFVHLVLVPGAYFARDLGRFRQCIIGLFTLYGLSFLGYTVFPAGGPHRWMTFTVPLEGVVVIPWTLRMVNEGSNGVDVFPSLHLGVSLYLLTFDWWYARHRFWWCLAPCIVLWFSTVLLRFHYLVDLLGGLAVAALGIAVAQRWAETSLSRHHRPDQ